MSWIKDNKFVAALGGGAAVSAGLLYFVGSSVGASKYDVAKEKFDADKAEAQGYESGPLYPSQPNRDGKTKAIDAYKGAIEKLQGEFKAYRPAEIKNISPQDFTNNLIAANTEIRAAFEEVGAKVPEPFFVGFEKYKTTLAGANSTGVLDYQLAGMKSVLLALAKAKPSELKNLHRPELGEESGQAFNAGNKSVRPYPMEITFTGPESSLREFMTAISKMESQFAVVHSIRILNTKKDPPKTTDAQFEKEASKPAASAGASGFSGGFVLPGEEPAAGAPPPPPAPEAAPAPKSTTGRILSQVLGMEQVQVFVRLDLMQFLPEKKL